MKFIFLTLLKKNRHAFLLFCLVTAATSSHAQIIGVERGTSNVVEIATNTGSITTLFNLPFTADFDVGMDYNPADGFLYLSHVNEGNMDIYRLNLVANSATYVKTINGIGLGSSSIGFTTNGNVYVYSDP